MKFQNHLGYRDEGQQWFLRGDTAAQTVSEGAETPPHPRQQLLFGCVWDAQLEVTVKTTET